MLKQVIPKAIAHALQKRMKTIKYAFELGNKITNNS